MRIEARVWAGPLLAVAAMAAIGGVVVNGQDERKSPFGAYHFVVEIAGMKMPFRSASGLKIETAVIEVQEGGNTDLIRKFAGPTRYPNIRLTRAFTGDRFLYDWHATIKKPDPARVDGRISMIDRHGTQLAAWTFRNGFPVKWEGPDLDASANEIAIETIEIAHEGLTMSDDND